jgi:hypothetical protein
LVREETGFAGTAKRHVYIVFDPANIGAVTARTLAFQIRDKNAFFYPNSQWRLPYFGGYQFVDSPGVTRTCQ